ncbi:hypothetical protein FACS1894174_02550 [Bacteroidia bacterium]|nr:hypothetical protein FACS1894155_12370 [Bacteroidia bacterium]GHV20527.1 hypothetical protein FACS1894174_02550 [Bacteroidia bacterium]
MKLVKIKLGELESFCSSETFRKFEIKPISPLRMKSYKANPRAKEEDAVLYMLIENEKLIAFRTILPDTVYTEDNTPIRFGWCSGIWVHPEYRGKKLWKPLLEEALKDWEDKLMLTNYAPKTLFLYIREDWFHTLSDRQGYRFYLNPDFKEILQERISNPVVKPLLSLANRMAALIYNIKKIILPSFNRIQIEELNRLDKECINLIHYYSDFSLFKREEKEIDWIMEYPWITEENSPEFHYPFSYSNIKHKTNVVKYYVKNHFAGFFIYSILNRKMKILYYYEKPGLLSSISIPIVKIAKANKISHLTILSPLLSETVKILSKHFLFTKHYQSDIYSTFSVNIDGRTIFDGDGDNSFT